LYRFSRGVALIVLCLNKEVWTSTVKGPGDPEAHAVDL